MRIVIALCAIAGLLLLGGCPTKNQGTNVPATPTWDNAEVESTGS